MEQDKFENDQIRNLGIDPDTLNLLQKETLLEPLNAPENYHHDGEVDNEQAREIWTKKMRKVGFTTLQIYNLQRKMGL